MQYLSLVLVSLLFLSFATYVFLGTYIIKLNPKGLINRLFLGACIAMSIWSMGLAMSMSSQTLEAGLFWQRFSAIGRTSVYAIILHFIIVLTKKNSNKLWFLYIPAFINLYLFSFSNRITGLQYQLIRTDIGLLNRPPHNGYNLFFYLYYISFMLITFIFSWKWTKGLESKKAIKQGKIILLSGIAAFVLGSVTDVFSGLVFKTPLPQLAPVFILLPTWSIYILARYFGFIGLKEQVKDELILTEDEQEKIFKNLSIAYLLGGIVSFLAKYNRFADNGKGDLISALQKGGSILLIGAFVYAAQGIKSKKTKENLTIGLLLFSIPLISLQFLERTSITIWALPIIIIMSSLIFSKKTMLISTTIVAIITQGVIWELKPESLVYVDQYNFIGRIGMFVIAFLVGSYINRIYTSKIKENTYKIKFQKMNSEVSLDFIALSKENFDEKMDSLLFKIGDFFGVERTYLFTVNHEKGTISYSNEWCAEGVEPENHGSGDFSVEEISWLLDQLKKNKSVYMEDVENEGKSHFSKAKTFVLVPVIGEGDIQGFIGMDSMRIKMKWSMEDINLLEIMASTVARGLLQIKADEEIEFMAYYDHLTRLPNRFLFQDRVNQRIEAAKKVASPISVVFLNLDNFKLINNTLGHNSGDALLKEIARALQGKLGKRDFVARFTGDEFLIMLTNLNVIDQVMAVFQEPFEINGQNVFVTASAGVGPT